MSTIQQYTVVTYYSDIDDLVTITGTASDVTLPNVVLPNISASILFAYAGVKCRMLENSDSSANAINGAGQTVQIKKSTGAWGVDDVTAIDLTDNMWLIQGSTREGGDVLIGDNDVVSEVDAMNATYNLRFEDVEVDANNLLLYDVQTFITVAYR